MAKYLFFDDDWKDLGDEVEYIYRKHKDAQDEMTKTIKNRGFGGMPPPNKIPNSSWKLEFQPIHIFKHIFYSFALLFLKEKNKNF